MYDEKLKGYEGYEEFEDICDVRGFEHAQEGRNMDVTVEDDDIKSCNNFDNIDLKTSIGSYYDIAKDKYPLMP